MENADASQPNPPLDRDTNTSPPADLDLLSWARRFLPEYFSDEPAPFHRELMSDLASDERLIARVAPRGHAKSTCAALAFPLWCICEKKRRNIVIITHESTLATQFVRDIRHELESNERILAHYGDLLSPNPTSDDTPIAESIPASEPTAARTRRPRAKSTSPRASERAAQASGTSRSPQSQSTASHRAARDADSPSAGGKSARRRTPSTAAAPRARRRKATQSLLVAGAGISVQAKSTGASFRGTRIGPHRPDLVICDDIEKDQHVETAAGRAKLEGWLRRVVMPALAPSGRIVVLGSLIHHDSLLANLRDPQRFPRWNYKIYRALEAQPTQDRVHEKSAGHVPQNPVRQDSQKPVGQISPNPVGQVSEPASAVGQVSQPAPSLFHIAPPSPPTFNLIPLWPARWPLARLQLERERIGTRAFEQEYQANPIDDSVRVFRPEWLRPYEPHDLVDRRLVNLMAVDPATGVAGGDYFALWVGSVDIDTGIIYTRELTLERIGVVDQVKRVRAAHAVWRPAKVGIETTAYQAALKQILDDVGRREHNYIPVHAIHAVSNKRARIEGSACFYENGTFRLPPLSPAVELQFIEFPKSRHDDAPDVCAMGIELARTINPGAPAECLLPSNGSSRRRHLW